MLKVKLENFRCFQDTGEIDVRPITFLVGENSAGKTTFLAGIRYLLESVWRGAIASFNRDPYYLGGFDQIAHIDRRGLRAEHFALSISLPGTRKRGGAPPSNFTFHFRKGAVQPELTEYLFQCSGLTMRVRLGDQLSIQISEFGKPDLDLPNLSEVGLPPMEAIRTDISFMAFILRGGPFTESTKLSKDDRERLDQLCDLYLEAVRSGRRRLFASSPVRTQPLRTYTPSEIDASSGGAHVPLELAKQQMGAPEKWRIAHEQLASFGHNSGLFKDIDIRRFGESDGDPFQIVVRGNGPLVNIVDVGYGVSQALPIIYQLQNTDRHDVFLLQQPEVHLHPRAQAEIGSLLAELSAANAENVYVVETHSDYILDRVRMKIAEGGLHHSQVTIAYFEANESGVSVRNIHLSEGGDIVDPPDGFRRFFLLEQQRLLGL